MRKLFLSVLAFSLALCARAQWTSWGLGLIQQPNAISGRWYLGITNVSQGSNVVIFYDPLTRSLVINAKPSGGGGSGTVTSFSSGNLSPLFTTSVATPTVTPAQSFALNNQAQNTIFSGPASGADSAPTFRLLSASDIPSLTLSKITDAGTLAAVNASGNAAQFLDGSKTFRTFLASDIPTLTLSKISDAGTVAAINLPGGTTTFLRADGNFGTPAGTGTLTGVSNSTYNTFGFSLISISNAPVIYLKSISAGANVSVTDQGTNLLLGSSNPGGTLTAVTNASYGLIGNSIISDSNAPTISLKSISAGTGVSITDNKTNLIVTASGGTGTLTTVTNAGGVISIITASNSPAPSFKSVSAGSNVTITDQGTNLVFASSGGGGGGSFDYSYAATNQPTYSGGTNFYVDFTWPAQQWVATNIAIHYSTNWPLNSQTSRMSSILILQTNIARRLVLYDAATNWLTYGISQPMVIPAGYSVKLEAQSFGPGETNTFVKFMLQNTPLWGAQVGFNPASVPGLVMWLDASRGVYTNANLSTLANNGDVVRGWMDQSGTGNNVTNTVAAPAIIYQTLAGPNSTPIVNFQGSAVTLSNTLRSAAVNYGQPNYIFIVYSFSANNAYLMGNNGMNMFVDSSTVLKMNAGAGLVAIGTLSAGPWRIMSAYQALGSSSTTVITNGVVMSTQAIGTTATTQFALGGNFDGTFQLASKIAEVLVYNAQISDVNRTNIVNYLNAKYAIY